MHIKLPISSHPWRCIEEDGTRCQWLRTRKFGSVWCCWLFSEQDDRGRLGELSERDGCLEKHPECLKRVRPVAIPVTVNEPDGLFPNCPYCGEFYEWHNGFVSPYGTGEGGPWDAECDACGRDFHVHEFVERKYAARKIVTPFTVQGEDVDAP